MNLSTVKARVDELIAMASEQRTSVGLQSSLYQGTLRVMQALYGPESSQEKDLRAYLTRLTAKVTPTLGVVISHCIEAIQGALTSIKAELDAGFIGSLRGTLTGEVLMDLIKLARETLAEPGDDAKNVAAVLAAAAFEDVLRKLSDLKGLGDHEKLMDVLTTLKNALVLQGSEVGIAQSYLHFRNQALHARCGAVDRPAVESVLAFTEQLILKHLT
jgi:hypothetical protein